MSFTLDLLALGEQVHDNLALVYQKVIIELLARIIEKTPVDSGRARANWQVALNVAPDDVTDSYDKAGSIALSKGEAEALKAMPEDEVYIINNVPYILKLEHGSSTQAPSGIIAITVEEFAGIVSGAANNVS